MTEVDKAILLALTGIMDAIQRMEVKQAEQGVQLTALIAALTADEEDEPELADLDGQPFGGERDGTQSLG